MDIRQEAVLPQRQKAAVAMLLKEEEITHVKLITPKGIELYLEVESTIRTADYVQCAVEKLQRR